MKPFIRIASLIIGIICVTTSCENEIVTPEPVATTVSSKITKKLIRMGINPVDAVNTTTINPDGETIKIVTIGEVMIPFDQLFEYPDLIADEGATKAFRNINLVDVGEGRNIKIVARYLEPESITGLKTAIFAYNQLGLKLTFSLEEGDQDGDVIVYRNNTISNVEGNVRSYLPYKGNPGGAIELFPTISNFSGLYRGVLFTRQLGRIIGLRSADWRTRRSCGFSDAIVDPTVIHIPGTDNSGDSTDSIVTECETSLLTLTNDDKVGLRFLYGDTSIDLCAPNAQRCDQSKPWKFFFCGKCFDSAETAVRNGCQEATNCVDGGSNTTHCTPNEKECDQSKPWKFFFCGACYENPQQAVDNGCQEASNCF